MIAEERRAIKVTVSSKARRGFSDFAGANHVSREALFESAGLLLAEGEWVNWHGNVVAARLVEQAQAIMERRRRRMGDTSGEGQRAV